MEEQLRLQELHRRQMAAQEWIVKPTEPVCSKRAPPQPKNAPVGYVLRRKESSSVLASAVALPGTFTLTAWKLLSGLEVFCWT
mmetsp:Transcript_10347/g.18432  ORF Transcript_10347/g.18432 Transcript_10347/m.18432 type:complete len:83 (+) Transcript_10347:184-432(+)